MSLTRRDGIPDYAARFAAAGTAAFAFDYRFWGDSDGEPRRWFSLRRQLEDWHAAIDAARAVEGIDPNRVAVWGMSLGGGHALRIAQTDRRIVAGRARADDRRLTTGARGGISEGRARAVGTRFARDDRPPAGDGPGRVSARRGSRADRP